MHKVLFITGLLLLGFTIGPGQANAQSSPNPNYTPIPPKEGYSYPACYCTDSNGQRVDMGKTACLVIGSRRVLARCGMSTNTPAWREQSEGCPGV